MSTVYMNLSLPIVSTTLGPAWATMLNAAITLVDSHDHTTNKGKRIPSAALNINADFDLNSYSPYNALSLKFSSQSAALTGATYASSIYVVSGNLYYTNSSGSAVQITNGGSLAAVPGAAQSFEVTSVSGDLTISPTDTFVHINVNTSAARSITLPSAAAVTSGRIYVIHDNSNTSSANNITITPDGSDTINLGSSLTIDSDGASIMLISNGASNWSIV